MATADYPFPDREDRQPTPFGMVAQLVIVAIGAAVALLAGIALVLVAAG
jgi:hypothetical protein